MHLYYTTPSKNPKPFILFTAATRAFGYSPDDSADDKTGKGKKYDLVIRHRQHIKRRCQQQQYPHSPQNRINYTSIFTFHFSLP